MTPKISIIIPVYNTEIYLKECLDSIINQTFKDIEIIIVNDCSPDNSEAIILEYMSNDPRIKYVKHDKNKSLLQARITGAKIAIGDYLFHVDSDDYLYTLDALQILSDTIDSTQAEVIQFNIQVDADWGEWFIPMSNTLITDPLQIKDLYFNNIRCSTLWSRIIKRDLYLKSTDSIPKDLFINMAEDFTQTPIIMNYANTYIGITDKLYYYRINTTSIANSEFTALKIQSDIESKKKVFDILSRNIDPSYFQNTKHALGGHVLSTMNILVHKPLVENDVSHLLSLFIEVFGEETYLFYLFAYDRKTIYLFWKHFQNKCSPPLPMNKTIGLLDNNLHVGGGQKISSILISQFSKRGYSVVLFTEEKPHPDDFDYSAVKERIILDGSLLENLSILKNSIKKHNIDLFIIQEYMLKEHFEIITIIKTLNKKIIHCIHSNLLNYYKNISETFCTAINQVPIYDAILCLYPQSMLYWRYLGFPNAYYLPNPLALESETILPSTLSQNTILWIGRLEKEKNPLAVIQAFHKALPYFKDPSTKLLILGNGPLDDFLQQYIQTHSLQKNVTLLGKQDSFLYYPKASLHISTSETEAFPMVIAEAKCHGVPTLMFELPYIAFHHTKGLLSVPQNDIDTLAKKMYEVLNNPVYLKELSTGALKSLEDFKTEKTMDKWEVLIQAVYNNQKQIPELEITTKESDTIELFNTMNDLLLSPQTLSAPEQQEYHNLQHDKWYNFGQLSRKQKIKKIIVVILKKLKIYPILKKLYNIIKK